MHWLTASKKANILPCECFCLLIPVYGKDANNCCTVYNKQAVHSSFAQSKRWTQACTLPYVMPMQRAAAMAKQMFLRVRCSMDLAVSMRCTRQL